MQEYLTKRSQYAQGMGGLPIVGDPDYVAAALADLSKAGLTGIGISLVNYLNELPYFCDEVIGRLERMGIREKPAREPYVRPGGQAARRGMSKNIRAGCALSCDYQENQMAKKSKATETNITRERLAELLNEDLSRE